MNKPKIHGVLAAAALTSVLGLMPAAAAAAPVGDAASGKKLYSQRCAMCHGSEGQGGAAAPSLKGVYGAKAASQAGQRYSDALRKSAKVWSPANLDGFLKAPRTAVPGTNMMVGVPKPEDRQNLIAYLATLRK